MRLLGPLFLLAAAPAGAALALSWRAARAGRRARAALRGLSALALALAAAGLTVRAGSPPRALVLLDRSASQGSALRASAGAALACGRLLSRRFEVGYVSFAAAPRPERPEDLGALRPDDSGTDLAAALEHARARLSAGEPAVLVSDGLGGAAFDAAAAGAGWGAPDGPRLLVLPGGVRAPDAALVELDAPAEAFPGERLTVSARLAGSAAGDGAVRVSLAGPGAPAGPVELLLPRGGRGVRAAVFAVRAPESGIAEYVATLSAPGDACAANDSARALVRVLARPRVAVVSADAAGSAAAAALAAAPGLEVRRLGPEGLDADLAGFAAVVLDDLPRQSLGGGRDARLAGYLRGGGGLLVLGGERAYGAGGWEDSGALERELPASCRPPGRKLFAVLVLDRSGSMGRPAGAAAGAESKLALVKRAATAALDCFGPGDQAVLVAFGGRPEVLAGPARPAEPEAAGRFRAALAGLEAGGPTRLADALAAAAALLPPAGDHELVRHVVLLSDGLPEGQGIDRAAEAARLRALARALAASGATLSTVSTGAADEDRRLLEELAALGRGRCHQPHGLEALEAAFRRELNPGEHVARGAFRPVAGDDALARALGGLPELSGRNRVSARPRARVVLEAPPAAGRGREPLLLVWDRGRGRAACFASQVGGEWGAAPAGPEGARLLGELARWAAGRTGRPGCRLALRPAAGGAGARLELVARDEADRPLALLAPVAELSDLSGSWTARAALLEESPSRYAAELSPPPGAAEVIATVADEKAGELARGAFPLNYPPELRRVGIDHQALSALARAAGGRMISAPAELAALTPAGAAGGAGGAWRGLAPWLAAAALALLVAELFLRALRR